MKANLLVVTSDEFEDTVTPHLEEHGFVLFFARGRLRAKEVFSKHEIDAVVWMFGEDEKGLAEDLSTIFKAHKSIPIVMVARKAADHTFSEKLENIHSVVDINDGAEDIRKVVEFACSQKSMERSAVPEEENVPEIKFKNVVSDLISNRGPTENDTIQNDKTLELDTQWFAVRESEKNIIYDTAGERKTSKLKGLLFPWRKPPNK